MELSPRRTVFQGRDGELLQRSHCPHSPQRGGHAGRCRNLPCPGPPSCCREEYPQPSPRGREGRGRGWLFFQALPGQKTSPGPPGKSGWRPPRSLSDVRMLFLLVSKPLTRNENPRKPSPGAATRPFFDWAGESEAPGEFPSRRILSSSGKTDERQHLFGGLWVVNRLPAGIVTTDVEPHSRRFVSLARQQRNLGSKLHRGRIRGGGDHP